MDCVLIQTETTLKSENTLILIAKLKVHMCIYSTTVSLSTVIFKQQYQFLFNLLFNKVTFHRLPLDTSPISQLVTSFK